MHQPDLQPAYVPPYDRPPRLLAVGWLESTHAFPAGPTPPELLAKLVRLTRRPWQPSVAGGFHVCSLCASDGARGTANVFIPGDGVVYVCPELITHYIEAHGYCPPEAFLQAVLACPPMLSFRYQRALEKTRFWER